jgi:isopenicillin N synthase-like dioxygenase
MATLRLLHYPAPPPGSDPQTGAGAHTDYGNLTLLATDDVGGLEVRTRAGEWIEAPVVPGAFIVNIGDCLMRWTNDVYVSTPIASSIEARESGTQSPFSTIRILMRWSKRFRAAWAEERSGAIRRSWLPTI